MSAKNHALPSRDVTNSLVTSFLFILLTLGIIMLATELFNVGSQLPRNVFFINLEEHFLGIFFIATSFYIQFSPRINLPLTPVTEAPAKIPISFFLVGTAFTFSSMRLLIPKPTSQYFQMFGIGIILLLSLVSFGYVLAKYCPPQFKNERI